MFAWVNVPSLGNGWQGIVAKSRIIAPWYGIWASSANEWVYGSSAANILGNPVTSGWHFISLVQDASLNARYLYVDGVKVGEAGAAPANGPGDLYFGRADEFSNEYFQGTLDEISISNAARSGSWISAQYSSTQDQFVTYSTGLPATGSGGGTASVLVQPQTTTWNFTSVPSGLELVVYGRPQTTPFSRQVIVNGVSTISATSPQTAGNTQYSFSSWSDGGAQTHLITAATSPQTYTATFSTPGGSLPGTGLPPVITSSRTVTGYKNAPFNYQITATNNASDFGVSGLPSGLSLNTRSGLISGIPTAAGTFRATIAAANASGATTEVLQVTIEDGTPVPGLPPTITSSRTVTGYKNAPFNYQITATNNPSDFGVSGLPSGLSLNTRSGLISGIPTAAGTFRATIAAANASGATTEVLQVTIEDGTPVPGLPPTITSSRTVTGYRNAPFNYQIIATNNPSDFGASGLPSGLSLNSRSGLISGIPTAAGTFRPTIAAANAFGATTEVLQVTIENVLGMINVSAPTLPTNPTMKRDMVLKPEGPTTENAQTLPETIWHSYDVVTQSGSPQATMKDSLGLKTATLEFYESVNNGGVDKGGLLSIFVPGVHNESFNHLEKLWTGKHD